MSRTLRSIARGSVRVYAFTLVELLVVIGIIAVLISILLPSLARARDAAVSIQCMSNLRTIGQFIALYANDNKGVFPMESYYGTTTSYQTWQDRLAAYDGRNLSDADLSAWAVPPTASTGKGLYQCPKDTDSNQAWAANFQFTSYCSNMVSSGQKDGYVWSIYERQSPADVTYRKNGMILGRHLSKIQDSSNVIMITEMTYAGTLKQFNKVNCPASTVPGLIQGMAEFVTYGVLGQTVVDTTEVPRPHGGVGASLKAISATQYGGNPLTLNIRTAGRYNYLMVDGHVASMDPWSETLSPRYANPEIEIINGMWVDGRCSYH